MAGIIEGTVPVSIGEVGGDRVVLTQTPPEGAEQRIELEMHQVEGVIDWLVAWLEESKEGLVNE